MHTTNRNKPYPLPAAVEHALKRKWPVIPLKPDKTPLVDWKTWQDQTAERSQVEGWGLQFQPQLWGFVTGKRSRVVVLDFDGEEGMRTLDTLGLIPHVRTPGGGAHVYLEHPGFPVKTRARFSKKLPSTDIRADGGYIAFCGNNLNGAYEALRPLEPDPTESLPPEVRKVCGLDAPAVAQPPAAQTPHERRRGRAATVRGRVDPARLVDKAMEKCQAEGRNAGGFWLAQQARDNGFSEAEAEGLVLGDYRPRTPPNNTKGQPEPYTEAEARASVRQVYQQAPREPWGSQPRTERPPAALGKGAGTPESEPPTPPAQDSAPSFNGAPYAVHEGGLLGWKYSNNGHISFKIANFAAKITEDRVMDDGTEEARYFVIQAEMAHVTSTIEIPAKDFRSMNWVAEKLGGMAIVFPGQAEHARTAIQLLSGKIPTVRAYSHTGWRFINGEPHYLHGRGAIGKAGNRTDITVNLRDTLPHYSFPNPPSGQIQMEAIRASLAVLDIAPDRLTFPTLAAVYRAILGPCTFSIHISGQSGQGKSQLAALAQQHFGKEMHADNLPAGWMNTGNATAALAFHAKDAVLVVDDFVASGNASSQQRLHGEADKLLRAQGNSTGRRRLNTEGKLGSNRPPRGLILSTGEHTPRGKSLNARMVILPFARGDMNWTRLTGCQQDASNGRLTACTAAFIQWTAPRLKELQHTMQESRFTRRGQCATDAPHMRTPENLDSLLFGLNTFFAFALEKGALTPAEFRQLHARAEQAFRDVERNEAGKHAENDPARIFLRLVKTAIRMGRAHLASPSGKAPDGEVLWGWQPIGTADERRPQGGRIGWVKKSDVWLDPEASFQIASKLAQERGQSLPGDVESMKRDLKEQGYLNQVDDKRRMFTVRKVVEGEVTAVLSLSLEKFQSASYDSADNADNADNSLFEEEDGVVKI